MLTTFVSKAHNYSQLFGWMLVQVLVTHQVLANTQALQSSSDSTLLTIPITLARTFQSLQCLEIILILLKINHGSLVATVAQQFGRIVVVYYFMSTESSPMKVVAVLIPWSLAQVNRYTYYLTKNSITTWLRYNAFIILYPLGISGEMMLINDYLRRNTSTLSQRDVMLIRGMQGVIILGFLSLYMYMFKNRSAKNNPSGQKKIQKRRTSASPPKRD